MMEDDNRVYYRVRNQWRATLPGCALHETPPDGWPDLDEKILKYAELIVWRGKILKDRWRTFDREDFLLGVRDL
jgi:hypothetical protein